MTLCTVRKTSQPHRVRSLSSRHLTQAAHLLTDAFWSNVVMRSIGGYDRGVFNRMMKDRVVRGMERNAVWVVMAAAGDGDGGGAGAGSAAGAAEEQDKGGEGEKDGKDVGCEDSADGANGGDEDEVVGVIIINPPGVEHAEIKKSYDTQNDIMAGISPEIKRWLDDEFYPWFGAWQTKTFGPNTLRDTLYINLLAVDSRYRRQGIGNVLIKEVLHEAREAEVGVTLLTQEPENPPYYEKFGFKVVGYDESEIRGEKVGWWGMLRDP